MNTPLKLQQFQCTECKTWAMAPFQFGDEETAMSATVFGNKISCPACGRLVSCNKENMRWARSDGKGGFVGDDVR
ncbi:hypothetical protein [Mitsuaria sp. GD03876]|uniref:hypothetical protein n=1 Tax=Mitsuaria sp. GD03876 TaxID=2975399 RepID=UPI002447ED72|nr:hypothetical protein [Mitsuaria sp. GD03876]MDH0867370.1 hypothetical protein [Mitsuaria sp. GD03876]